MPKRIKSKVQLFSNLRDLLHVTDIAIIIRGQQGAGKTTLAKTIAQRFIGRKMRVKRIETDMYFTKNGNYEWVREKLPEAHEWCRNTFKKSLEANDITIVSNVFKTRGSVHEYAKMAKLAGVKPVIIRLKTNHPNVHGVPEECVRDTEEHMENIAYEWVIEEDL